MIRFTLDSANVMMDSNNSVASRFKENIPYIFIMKCICHSFHLCAWFNCTKRPSWVENTLYDM